MLHLDCDLVIPWYYTVEKAHETGNALKDILEDEFKGKMETTLHFDPCNIFPYPLCNECKLECPHRKEAFVKQYPFDFKNITREGDEK